MAQCSNLLWSLVTMRLQSVSWHSAVTYSDLPWPWGYNQYHDTVQWLTLISRDHEVTVSIMAQCSDLLWSPVTMRLQSVSWHSALIYSDLPWPWGYSQYHDTVKWLTLISRDHEVTVSIMTQCSDLFWSPVTMRLQSVSWHSAVIYSDLPWPWGYSQYHGTVQWLTLISRDHEVIISIMAQYSDLLWSPVTMRLQSVSWHSTVTYSDLPWPWDYSRYHGTVQWLEILAAES